jgi:membrane protease YdiL (CAAX protease family)
MTDPQEPPPPVAGEQPPQPAPELEPLPPPPADRDPFWSYLDLVLLVLLAVPLLLLTSLLVGGAVAVFHWPLRKVAVLLAAQFLFYALWFLLLYQILRLRYGRPFWSSLGWVRTPYPPWTYAGWGLLIAAFCVGLSALLPRTHVRIPLEELLQDRSSILLVGVFAVSLGPLAEELAFRGFLMPLLVRTFGVAGGVVLQALPFALLHGPEYGWAWQQLIVMFLAGAAFGLVRHRAGSTAAAAYAHAAFNLTAVAGALAQSHSR